MNVLVTGAAGFIGTHLTRELLEAGHDVMGLDRLGTSGPRMMCADLLNAHSGWLKDCARVTGFQPEVVIHLAAKVGRLFGEDDVKRTVLDNAAMTSHLAQECGDAGVRLMYASTSEVYGDWGDQLCGEDDPFTRVPHNIYGLSKRWGEEACRLYADGPTLMRFSMPYGPGLPAGRGRAALINFLYNAVHGLPITVHRGSERSWCWVGDTVRAVRMLLELERQGPFNIGRDDNALPMVEVARVACDLAGASHGLIVEVDPPGRQTVVKRLATSKIRAVGWEPHVDLEEGMWRTLQWVRELPAPADAPAAVRAA